jgi:hypothetical protein
MNVCEKTCAAKAALSWIKVRGIKKWAVHRPVCKLLPNIRGILQGARTIFRESQVSGGGLKQRVGLPISASKDKKEGLPQKKHTKKSGVRDVFHGC